METSRETVRERSLLGASALVAAFVLATALPAAATVAPQGMTTRASVDSNGTEGSSSSALLYGRSLSADGRFVTFISASAFVPSATNKVYDNLGPSVFVHDRQTGTAELISVNATGAASIYGGYWPAISGNGLHVAFTSHAYDLVHGDTNNFPDVFVRDREYGVMTRASVSSTGEQGNSWSQFPAISGDGSQVAFESYSSNLVSGDTNSAFDIFVRDLTQSLTTRVSLASNGAQANGGSYHCTISADGRHVAFASDAANLVPGDTNGTQDVFVHERGSGMTARVSVDSSGAQASGRSTHPVLSADGRFVAFVSEAPDLVTGDTNGVADIFVHDRQSGQTRRVSVGPAGGQANAPSGAPAISADGSRVAFQSDASNLLLGDTNGTTDTFLHDLATGRTERLSVDSDGVQGNAQSGMPSISADGRLACFQSAAGNLVKGDSNGVPDVFVRDRECGVSIYCTAKLSSALCIPAIGFSGTPSASAGQGFLIEATDFAPLQPGIFAYGKLGPAAVPFQGGFVCAQVPLVRIPVANTGALGPCEGSFSLDFNAYVASGADPALVAGKTVWGQWWARDPGLPPPSNASLSDAIRVTLCP
jgi:Tol biopolymer transport system component